MREKTFASGIARQSSSYRQGLVLGLTMAEVMLLLIFCLLIATGVLLAKEKQARLQLEDRLHQAQWARDANAHVAKLLEDSLPLREALERKAGSADPAKIDAFWRKLVESATVVDELERYGLTPEDMHKEAKDLAEAHKLRVQGIALKEARHNAELMTKIGEKWGDQKKATDAAILDAVTKGLADPVMGGHRWPPIIKLSEADGYFFESGKAELRPDFERALHTSVVASLLKIAKDYDVDVIEVIGHTDEQPLSPRSSNLDKELSSTLNAPEMISHLHPADNAGLGLARAVAVVGVLASDKRLDGYKILPLSGAQLIQTDETLARVSMPGDVKERRRIEIRLRKSAAALETPAKTSATPF